MSSEACSMRSTVAISLVIGRLGHATCGSRPTAAFRCTPRWQGPYGQASIGMPRSSEGKLLCPSKVVAVLLRLCMSDLDNTSESIARFEFTFPLAAPRAEPRECEGRLFPAVPVYGTAAVRDALVVRSERLHRNFLQTRRELANEPHGMRAIGRAGGSPGA
jgi:hypothetical protein